MSGPHVWKCEMKQLNDWLKKNCAVGQPWDTQSAMHVTEMFGGRMLKSTHMSEHVSIWKQLFTTHCPQSWGQLMQVS